MAKPLGRVASHFAWRTFQNLSPDTTIREAAAVLRLCTAPRIL